MTFEEERLRCLLADHSSEIPSPMDRLGVLHRRIGRHRRARVAGVVGAVLLASVGLVTIPSVDRAPSRPSAMPSSAPTPTVTASPAPSPVDDMLPEYFSGYRRILAREMTLPPGL